MSNSRYKMYHLLIPLITEKVEIVNSIAPDDRAHETPRLAQCCLPYGV